LRDDIIALFNKLNNLLKIKYIILKKIYRGEPEKSYLLKTNSITSLNEELESDSFHIERINSIDFDISDVKKGISIIAGIGVNKFDEYFSRSETKQFSRYMGLSKKTASLLKKITDERDRLIGDMEGVKAGIGSDIDSIGRIIRLKDITPGGTDK
jgi:hypothetical protein